jgi:hypothetical protein
VSTDFETSKQCLARVVWHFETGDCEYANHGHIDDPKALQQLHDGATPSSLLSFSWEIHHSDSRRWILGGGSSKGVCLSYEIDRGCLSLLDLLQLAVSKISRHGAGLYAPKSTFKPTTNKPNVMLY